MGGFFLPAFYSIWPFSDTVQCHRGAVMFCPSCQLDEINNYLPEELLGMPVSDYLDWVRGARKARSL